MAEGGILAFPVQLWAGYEGIAVIDTRSRHLCLYQYQMGQPVEARLVLLAARKLEWDLQLEDYNTGSPKPREVQAILERSRQIRQGQVPASEVKNPDEKTVSPPGGGQEAEKSK